MDAIHERHCRRPFLSMSPYSYCNDKAYVELLTFGMLVFAVMLGVIFFLVHKIQNLLSYIQRNLASREAKN